MSPVRFFAACLGAIVSCISVAKLVSVGLTEGATGVLALCFTWWDALLNFLFGWATPHLKWWLAYLAGWFSIKIDLLDHWYHVLVLVGLYVTSDILFDWFRSRDSKEEPDPEVRRRRVISALATVAVGYPIAIAVSVIVGTVDLIGIDRLAIIFAICGFVLYEIFRSILLAGLFPHVGKTFWGTFRNFFLRLPVMNAVCGGIALTLGNYVNWRGVQAPNILVLLFFIVLYALLAKLLVPAVYVMRAPPGQRWSRYFKFATVKVGLRVLAIVAAAVLVVLGNAGL